MAPFTILRNVFAILAPIPCKSHASVPAFQGDSHQVRRKGEVQDVTYGVRVLPEERGSKVQFHIVTVCKVQ